MLFRYRFGAEIDMDDVQAALVLAAWGVESLHGETQARLASGHAVDRANKLCVIDTGTKAGDDLNTLFYGFIRHELGDAACVVERLHRHKEMSA